MIKKQSFSLKVPIVFIDCHWIELYAIRRPDPKSSIFNSLAKF